ncbi:MAG: SDR family oxidoreductase [Candidatus Obscuribacterales bacterium]|jgi:NAD(P)-dependent dehydrogenase (short-subunit alcohol dehydrogenase family)|nr:SDR family oxidoreductase [Candidatus Obscuribacterales bacterium]
MKVAIVTGASRGIGASVAAGLAADGYAVALVARSKEALAQVASDIKKSRAKEPIATYVLDVSDDQAVAAMVASVQSTWGSIDLLFNNAGMYIAGSAGMNIADFDRLLSVNLRGAFSFLHAVVPIMKKQSSGMIINLSSRSGKFGFVDNGVYSASKFGLVGLNESLYRELSPLGIKVTALCPSWVDTAMQDSDLPTEEIIATADILKAVRFLLSLSPAAVVKEMIIECRTRIA